MPTQPSPTTRTWAFPAVVAVVVALLVTLVLTLDRGGAASDGASQAGTDPTAAEQDAGPAGQDPPTEVQGPVQPDLTDVERRDEEDVLTAGPVDAPVTLIVFSDYQCPYCARWHEETLPLMMERAQAGELRIEWRDLNIFGEASERASRASYAAALQGAFWDYHDELYPGGEIRRPDGLTDEALVALAVELGLDTEQFAEDMSSAQTQEQVRQNAQLGLDLGAYSTPTFVLGGQPLVGAQPSQVFVEAVDEALAGAR